MTDRCQAYLYASELSSATSAARAARDEAAAARANAAGNSDTLQLIREELGGISSTLWEIHEEARARRNLEALVALVRQECEAQACLYQELDAMDPTKPIGHEKADVFRAMATTPELNKALEKLEKGEDL